MRKLLPFLLVLCGCFVTLHAHAQTGTITGQVSDTQGAIVPNAQVRIVSETQGTTQTLHTNDAGRYTAPFLQPGPYRVSAQAQGFSIAESDTLTLSVGQTLVFDVRLKVGAEEQQVVVEAGSQAINTTDATVGTVIDRQFVENIPMNGRSFQSLILLSPGVVTSTPQGQGESAGEFSVNGQRTDANNYMVDGVSANNGGVTYASTGGAAGMDAASTGLGTTQAILSVDALQEFRIATSTYSAEYGRQPGAQISLQSRSGTNAYHGTAFDYIRNYAFDANNWFNDYSTPPLPKPLERQNDFGGVLGGPLTVPKLFSGKDRAFFFFSYEGLRVTQPQAAHVYYVPSNGTYNTGTYSNPLYKNLRANAPAALQPVLNAFPLPNCSISQDPQCVDYGDGFSPYLSSASSPSSVNSIMARIDFQISPRERVFARYSDTDSRTLSYDSIGPTQYNSSSRTRFFLLGADSLISGSLTNELRLQYSPASALTVDTGTPSGGAHPVNLWTLQGLPAAGETVAYFEDPNIGPEDRLYQVHDGGLQFQSNAVDTVSWTHGSHLFKAGVDYRQTTAYLGDGDLSRGPDAWYYFTTPDSILQNVATSLTAINFLRQDTTFKSLGVFFQDEWRLRPRLSLSLGLRWELNPPPSISGAKQYTYTGDLNNPSSVALSRLGAPLYKTTYHDFAPRFGIAMTIRNEPGHELVLRGGGGIFYDIGGAFWIAIGDGEDLGTGNYQNLGSTFNKPYGFPVPPNVVLAPIPPIAPSYSLGYIVDPHLVPPSTIQWNASMEQALGPGQSITLGYLGSEGRNLVIGQEYNISSVNPLFSPFYQYQNGPGSSYNALQLQYRRQMLHGLEVQSSYTWAHAIDSQSNDSAFLPFERGNSDYDIRNNFTAALVYSVPTQYPHAWQRTVLGNWDPDLWCVARSGFPVQLSGPTLIDPVTGQQVGGRLNYNGQNPYVYKKGIPGGRQFNPAVFSAPLASQNGNGNSPRNFLRGFGENQINFAMQRTFPIYEQLHLQFRAEAFNIFNHPNFGAVNASCGTSVAGAVCTNQLIGQATGTLSAAPLGGLSTLYQLGGPRSLQFALKLQF